jgi:hypothetical protein
MIRRSAFEAVGGYREAFRFTQDLDLWLRVAERFELDNLAGVFYQWRVSSEGIYTVHRTEQLKYGGLARVFARERRIYGQDSYEALHDAKDDLDAFAARYRLRGFLHARWGELLLRASQNTVTASEHFRRALTNGCIGPRVLALYLWSRAGLRWPGSSPLATSVPSGWRASS